MKTKKNNSKKSYNDIEQIIFEIKEKYKKNEKDDKDKDKKDKDAKDKIDKDVKHIKKKNNVIYGKKTKKNINEYFKKLISIKTREYSAYTTLVKNILEKDKSEWDFKSSKDYTQKLENLGKYYGNLYLEQLMKQFPKFFYKHKKYLIEVCEQNDLYGKPNIRPFPSFTTCSATNLRYILHALLILTFMTNHKINNIDIIEIGGGYGGLSFFMHKIAPLFKINITSYTIIDLPEISLLQKNYLDALDMSKNMHFYNINNYNNLKKNSFLISNYAYSEISIELQQEYTEKILNPYISYGFLVWNYIEIYDFIKDKIILKEYEEPDTSHNNTNYYITILPKDTMQNGKSYRQNNKNKNRNRNKNKNKNKNKNRKIQNYRYKKYSKKL